MSHYGLPMTKPQAGIWGKRLFILGLVVFALGSPFGWLLYLAVWRPPWEPGLFVIPGVGLGLILVSFGFMAYGSRVGKQ